MSAGMSCDFTTVSVRLYKGASAINGMSNVGSLAGEAVGEGCMSSMKLHYCNCRQAF